MSRHGWIWLGALTGATIGTWVYTFITWPGMWS